MKKLTASMILVALASACYGQIDSFAAKIKRAEGLKKASVYYEAVYYYLRNNPSTALKYAKESEAFAKSQNDRGISAYAQLNYGIYYSAFGKLDSAIFFLEEAHALASQSLDKELLTKINSSLGKTYVSDGKAEKGLQRLFEAMHWLGDAPNSETELKVRINICWAYLELKRYRDCINYGQQSLPVVSKPFEWMLPYFYNNMAVSYGALHNLDSARILIDKSLQIAKATDQFHVLANAHFILGTIYSNSEKYEWAAAEYLKAKPYREKLGDMLFLVSDLYTLSDLYFKMNRFQKGIDVGKEALRLATDNQLTLKFEGVYTALAKNYEGLGDYKSASHYYNLLAAAKDTVYKHATSGAIAEMQGKYETEKKNRQISELNKTNELKSTIIERNYLIMAGMGLLVTVLILVFYLWRYRNLHMQKMIAQEQKERLREAQIQAVIQSQEQERKRFASDLHDGMGQLVSALQWNIQSLKDKEDREKTILLVENSEQLLKDIQQEIRNIAFNLMPPILVKEGLVAAVRELIRRLNKTSGFNAEIVVYDVKNRLPDVIEISVYRIVQELLSNVIKYGSASQLTVSFTGYETEIILTLEDNGEGYDLSKFQNSTTSNGWRTIQTRLNLIRGQIEFDTIAGRKNNTTTIHIPISNPLRDVNPLFRQNTES